MSEHLSFVEGLMVRLHGPMSFRFVLQPLIAVFFAFRDGRKDAEMGRVPFFWALFTDAAHRTDMVRTGWKSIGKVFLIAIVLDFIFQHIVFKDLRPLGAVIAGLILAIVPYLVLRGPMSRLMRRTSKGREP